MPPNTAGGYTLCVEPLGDGNDRQAGNSEFPNSLDHFEFGLVGLKVMSISCKARPVWDLPDPFAARLFHRQSSSRTASDERSLVLAEHVNNAPHQLPFRPSAVPVAIGGENAGAGLPGESLDHCGEDNVPRKAIPLANKQNPCPVQPERFQRSYEPRSLL